MLKLTAAVADVLHRPATRFGNDRQHQQTAHDKTAFSDDTAGMPIEETLWDVMVHRNVASRHDLRPVLTEAVRRRLPSHKRLLRLTAWSTGAEKLYPRCGQARRYAVSYLVEATG